MEHKPAYQLKLNTFRPKINLELVIMRAWYDDTRINEDGNCYLGKASYYSFKRKNTVLFIFDDSSIKVFVCV